MTTKTLQQLSELMGSEALLYNKCCSYACACTDPVLKIKLGEYAQKHRERFCGLFDYLNSNQ